ncbi:MAG: arsenite efflux MFS transporter ArsK [Flavobacteriaceae bacterium]
MTDTAAPPLAIVGLGLTQIVGYGTLYYSFPIVVPAIASELMISPQWVFAVLSAALLLGSLVAPTAGRLADRLGAARLMAAGSAAAALALVAAAAAPGAISLCAAFVFMQLAASFVLYATAFVAIVQIGPHGAQRAIVYLTLIAGFASTIFWPFADFLHGHFSWRGVFLVFAALHLFLCLPIHAALTRLSRRRQRARALDPLPDFQPDEPALDPTRARAFFPVLLFGFAAEGFVLAAILLHMVPLVDTLGPAGAGVALATLFGPAQVASRLVNMVFGGRLPQRHLAVIAAILMAVAPLLLIFGAPWHLLIAGFVFLFGLGSGLTSIVGGTLPLELFGRIGYGARVGWVAGARQFSSALAPFVFSVLMGATSPEFALWSVVIVAVTGLSAFIAIAAVADRATMRRTNAHLR